MNRSKTIIRNQRRGAGRRFLNDRLGAAAVEFVLWCAVLVVPILSAIDIAYYAYQRMQVDLAAHAAAQAAFHSCDPMTQLPAASKCNSVVSNITAAAQSTSLGTSVTLASPPTEGYYCANNANQLVLMGTLVPIIQDGGTGPTVPNPFTCSGVVSGSTSIPGDYITVTVTHNFTPIFVGISVANLLSAQIHRTVWMRLA
jgi:Flp pilus assembly protein TadG